MDGNRDSESAEFHFILKVRYFPRRSRLNQTNHLFLEDILLESHLAHLKVTRQLTTEY